MPKFPVLLVLASLVPAVAVAKPTVAHRRSRTAHIATRAPAPRPLRLDPSLTNFADGGDQPRLAFRSANAGEGRLNLAVERRFADGAVASFGLQRQSDHILDTHRVNFGGDLQPGPGDSLFGAALRYTFR